MPGPSEPQVLSALSKIVDPDLGRDVVSLGMIKDLLIDPDGAISFTFELTTPACPVRDRFKAQAEEIVADLPGVRAVNVKMTSNVRQGGVRNAQNANLLPGVRQTVAIASGKGGVGKSTVAVNLAASLKLSGARVGLLDADIYGPSVPGLTGVKEQPQVAERRQPDGSVARKLIPLEAYGVKLMSIGFISGDTTTAMVWRGPMVSRAISQFMEDVDWGELDYLIIDLPPGTGDASLTVAQAIPLTGVVVVSTPQDVAVEIAVKALQMFRQLNVTPLGMIENMSWFTCADCASKHHPFGHGGAERAAQRLGVPYLGALPLETELREEADRGAPIVVAQPDSESARAFREISSNVAARTSIQSFRRLPVINVR